MTRSGVYTYLKRLLIAFSVLINVILGGRSNQTFSARNYDRKKRGLWNIVPLIDAIFWFDPEHCLTSWVYWAVRKDVMSKNKIGDTL